jgi:hypothetical protein
VSWRQQNAVRCEREAQWCVRGVAVGCAIVGCLGNVGNEFGYGSICDKQYVEGKVKVLDCIELG